MISGFVIATVILLLLFMFLLIFNIMAGFSQTWFFIKMKMGKRRNWGWIFRFTKNGGLCEQYIGKVPEEVSKNKTLGKKLPDGTLGTKILNPQHFDAKTRLPMYFVFEGNFTSSDFKNLFINDEVLKMALDKFPNLKKELSKIPLSNKQNLFEYITSLDTKKKVSDNKMGDLLNTIYVRAYNLGVIKGKKSAQQSITGGKTGYLLIGVAIIIALVAAYFGYTNHATLATLQDSIGKIAASTTHVVGKTGATIIPGK